MRSHREQALHARCLPGFSKLARVQRRKQFRKTSPRGRGAWLVPQATGMCMAGKLRSGKVKLSGADHSGMEGARSRRLSFSSRLWISPWEVISPLFFQLGWGWGGGRRDFSLVKLNPLHHPWSLLQSSTLEATLPSLGKNVLESRTTWRGSSL